MGTSLQLLMYVVFTMNADVFSFTQSIGKHVRLFNKCNQSG
jgi:hypothetical protein